MTGKMVGDFAKKDLYAVLNISPLALSAEIPPAYRRAALLAHPDKGGSGDAFQLVTHAFEVLACASSRKSYDQARRYMMKSVEVETVAAQQKHDASSCVSTSVNSSQVRSDGEDIGVKRSAPEAGPPPKKRRTRVMSKNSARIGTTEAESKGCKHSQITLEEALSTALEGLKKVLQDMCVEQRRQGISKMALRVRTALLTFMEKQIQQTVAPTLHAETSKHEEKAILPLEDAVGDLDHNMDPNCVRKTSDDPVVTKKIETKPIARQSPPLAFAFSRIGCTSRSSQMHTAGTPFVQTRNFNVARWKQQMTGIQCKRGRYKAHLHIKSFRIYTNSHATIEMALDHQIILMQIRSAWLGAWQSDPNMWEEHPEQFAALCRQVLEANGTSEGDMGLKAFVSMEARIWLGKNCFVISPVMELLEALEWHAKLLRARHVSWPVFRAEWVELMQCKRHAQAKVRSAEEAQVFADAAYEKHQLFHIQHIHERKMRDEARNIARQQRREKEERQRQIERERRMQTRSARQKTKAHALLEKRLVKAVRSVERALDLKARNITRRQTAGEARAKMKSGKAANVRHHVRKGHVSSYFVAQ